MCVCVRSQRSPYIVNIDQMDPKLQLPNLPPWQVPWQSPPPVLESSLKQHRAHFFVALAIAGALPIGFGCIFAAGCAFAFDLWQPMSFPPSFLTTAYPEHFGWLCVIRYGIRPGYNAIFNLDRDVILANVFMIAVLNLLALLLADILYAAADPPP